MKALLHEPPPIGHSANPTTAGFPSVESRSYSPSVSAEVTRSENSTPPAPNARFGNIESSKSPDGCHSDVANPLRSSKPGVMSIEPVYATSTNPVVGRTTVWLALSMWMTIAWLVAGRTSAAPNARKAAIFLDMLILPVGPRLLPRGQQCKMRASERNQ